jgi:CubicO group peptidase (beta-lactamase class C family)
MNQQVSQAPETPSFVVPGFRSPRIRTTVARWDRTPELDRVIGEAISAHRIVGAEVIVARDGEIVYQRAAGLADRESNRAVRSDEIFRLASMTKAIVSVAALALVDRGTLWLHDPVTRWLPEFRPKLASGQEPLITLRHLITHTAGLGYGFLEAPDGPYHQLGVSDGLDQSHLTLDENLRRIAAAPLLFEPGTSWHYSVSVDVLGAIIEHATGMSLARAVQDLVTAPLGMDSVEFGAHAGTSLATPYADATAIPTRMSSSHKLPFFGGAIDYAPGRAYDRNAFASGGTGMVGNAKDYLRFLEAIRTGGAGVLRPETAAAMTHNAIGDLASGPGFGWGLGVQVLKDPAAAQTPLSAGSWNWGGVYGTHFWVDPRAALSVVALTNTAVAGMLGEFPLALQRAVYSK